MNEEIDYSNNEEYLHGRFDGFKDAMEQNTHRNLDYRDESYLLGYFAGRNEAEATPLDTLDEDL